MITMFTSCSCAVASESRHLRNGPYIGDLETVNVSTSGKWNRESIMDVRTAVASAERGYSVEN